MISKCSRYGGLSIAGMTASLAIVAVPRIPHRTRFMTHRLSAIAIVANCGRADLSEPESVVVPG